MVCLDNGSYLLFTEIPPSPLEGAFGTEENHHGNSFVHDSNMCFGPVEQISRSTPMDALERSHRVFAALDFWKQIGFGEKQTWVSDL
ncbi:hypothetical protein G6F43_013146 [Rhizopus delemar]|nr:hypothetical protein G6F43_013146 [Rhizopus delemar]